MKDFIKRAILKELGDDFDAQQLYNESQLIQYIDLKTNAIHGDTKSRRSLANIYAVYSLLHFYIKDFFNNPQAYRDFDK